jgi:DNA-binding NarL/FixJ family response regulator
MRVLLVDDHPLFLEGLKTLLTLRGVEVVGTAEDGREGLEKARALKPEVVLMDIKMPNMDGLTATRLIKAEVPDAKIVMLTMSEDDQDLFEAIKYGACGYMIKTEDTEKFFELLEGLVRGEAPLSPSLAGRVLEEFARKGRPGGSRLESGEEGEEILTPRQLQVLTLVAQGLTYKEVGVRLFISERTIKYHMGEILERLHMENRREAIEFAKRLKLGKR